MTATQITAHLITHFQGETQNFVAAQSLDHNPIEHGWLSQQEGPEPKVTYLTLLLFVCIHVPCLQVTIRYKGHAETENVLFGISPGTKPAYCSISLWYFE